MGEADPIGQGRLGHSRGTIVIATLSEHRRAVLRLAAQARRRLEIFSRALDPRIYGGTELADAVRALLLTGPRASVRVVVQQTDILVRGHRLLELARHLSSSLEIRRAGPSHRNLDEAFVVADAIGVLELEHAERYEARLDFCTPRRARELGQRFAELWAHAVRDPALLRLHI